MLIRPYFNPVKIPEVLSFRLENLKKAAIK